MSRNAKSVTDFLELDARKLEGEWTLGGDLSLLNAERDVHHLYRWTQGEELRIDAIYGVGDPYLEGLAAPWVGERSDFICITYPIALLWQSMLDVWIGCYPDFPEEDPDFSVIHLSRYPAFFLVDRAHPLFVHPAALELEGLRGGGRCSHSPRVPFPRCKCI